MRHGGVLAAGVAALLLAGCENGGFPSLGGNLDMRPEQIQASAPRPEPDSRGLITYPNYQVIVARPGDTIASVAARIGMDPAELARYNGLPLDYRPRAGEVLALPKGAVIPTEGPVQVGTTTSNLESIAATAIGRAGSSEPVAVAPVAPPRSQIQPGPEPIRHIVEPGETAYSIARLYGVSVQALANWNGLDKNLTVRTGQRLMIPVVADGTPQREVAMVETTPGQGSPTPVPPSAVAPLPESEKIVTDAPPSPDLVKERTGASDVPRMQRPVEGKILKAYSPGPRGNEGIDFEAPKGTPVRAADDGEVALISTVSGNAKIVLVRHPGNLYTVYSNVSDVPVKKGQKVSRGQTIGKVAGGSPSYVHFEIRKGTESVDPAPYL